VGDIEMFVANPLELEAATRAVALALAKQGAIWSHAVAEDIAYQAIKAGHNALFGNREAARAAYAETKGDPSAVIDLLVRARR
jgi:hypothetical protein